MGAKIKRYHKSLFFPPWSEDAIGEFVASILKKGPLTFSLHSVEKIVWYCLEYGRITLKFVVKSMRKGHLNFDNIFEFYAVDKSVKKVCFRFTFTDFPVDFVLVISADGVVITAYVINKGDNHATLDEKLYERK